MKHEVRQLREEAENARAAAEETAALRRIAERQLAEALEALQAEREAKFAAKKELDAHLSREAAYNITNLAYSIRGKCLLIPQSNLTVINVKFKNSVTILIF